MKTIGGSGRIAARRKCLPSPLRSADVLRCLPDGVAFLTALSLAPPSSYVNVTSGVTAEGEGVNADFAESSACSVASTPEVTDKKSSALLDVKPWDHESDMRKLEDDVRGVKMKGLLWVWGA
nr:unnamed protein product [Digitaria exilis]